jgi:DNA-binding MarR family transcriptional regulator
MPLPAESQRASVKPCRMIDDPETADLTWLMHRAVATLAAVSDRVCREWGLADHRDWLVLATVGDGERRTQYELSQALCIDKSTLMAIVDRLEGQGFVVREHSPTDRRVRLPVATERGRDLAELVTRKRDEAIAEHLSVVPEAAQTALRRTLWSVMTGRPEAAA